MSRLVSVHPSARRDPGRGARAARRVLVAGSSALLVTLAGCERPTAPVPAQPQVKASEAKQQLNARVIQYKNQIQKDPYSASARLGLGRVLLEQGDPRSAERELSRALELGVDPNLALPVLARTWNLLGRSKELIQTHAGTTLSDAKAWAELKTALANAYANTGEPAKARALAEAALRDDPESPRVRVLQAQIALSDRRVDEAMRIVDDTLAAHPQAVEAWELKGDVLLTAKGDTAGAASAYERALAVEVSNLPVQAKLISLALSTRDFDTAKKRLATMAEVAPGSLPHRYFTARLAYARGDLALAREAIKVALAEFPKDLRSLMLSAEMDLKAGSLRTAEESLAMALVIGPRVPRTRHLLAQVYLRMGAPEKAQMILDPLVRYNKSDATALGLSAEAALQAGLTRVATRLFELAAAADPTNPRYRAALAIARISGGDFQGGFGELESAAASDPTAYADMALLSTRLSLGDLAAATRAAESVARKQPQRATPQWMLGQLKRREGKLDEARRYYDRALEFDKAFVPAAIALAELDLGADDVPSARRRFEGVLAQDPTNLDAMLALAEIDYRAGTAPGKVAAALQKAVQLHSGQARAQLALINHHMRMGDGPAALLVAQSAAAIAPDDLSLTDALGRAQASAGDSASALTTFRRIVTARPRAPEPHARMADIYESRGEVDAAIGALKEALRLQPALLSAHTKLVSLATAKKDWAMARSAARNVQTRFPKDPRGYHLEGLVYAAQRQWEPALTAFRAAATRRESSELTLQIHSALQAAGKTEEAQRVAVQWLAKHPKDAYFIGYLGETAIVARDFATAETHFRAVLALDPRSVDAMNNLAWALIEQSKPGAVELARKAAELQPRRADVLDTLSSALAAENQFSAALSNQKRAVSLAPQVPALRLNLARLALQAKDYPLARAELDKLSALGKAYPAQAEVWQLRQQLP